jgi:acyl-CoA synthetase (AMP-forming)/AMP-acid ligase II
VKNSIQHETLSAALTSAFRTHEDRSFNFPALKRSIPYPEMGAMASAAAKGLLAAGMGRGERIGLLFTTSPEFIATFAGVLMAGGVVVPLPHPGGSRALSAYVARLARILATANMRFVVAGDEFESYAATLAQAAGAQVTVLQGKALTAGHIEGPQLADIAVGPDDLALVQYTSGSTSEPKGVALTHKNLMANLRAITAGIALSRDDVNGQWLPLHHDMGLIGMLAGTLAGVVHHLSPPTAFVRNPAQWLLEFGRVRATIYSGPSFSYASMLRKVTEAQLESLDLSAWRVAFNGAEVIDPDVVSAFTARFGKAGFRPTTMFPVYGLAEATLAITFPPLARHPGALWIDADVLANEGRVRPLQRAAPRARGLVAVGRALPEHEIRIVGPDLTPLPDGYSGEIQIRGPSVMKQYLGMTPEESGVSEDGWTRTGDLGFLHEGDLYVTGRTKEMMIVRGAKYYPFDVECAARSVPGVYGEHVVAFATQDHGAERMVVVAELGESPAGPAALAQALREKILADVGLNELQILLAKPKSLPRTTSGKFQRLALRERFRSGDLKDLLVEVE